MSTTINKGWLTDNNGNKFAPKTLLSQVQTSDGKLLEVKIAEDILVVVNKIAELEARIASLEAELSNSVTRLSNM